MSRALGAPVLRVVREPLLESILLSLFGGAAGLAIAFAGTRLILQLAFPALGQAGCPSGVPFPARASVRFRHVARDGIIFGIMPAWMATRADPIEALRGAGRATPGQARSREKRSLFCRPRSRSSC